MAVPGTDEAPSRPVVSVVHGAPTPEELAVVVVLLAAGGGGVDDEPAAPDSRWSAPAARLGSASPARDAWRFSGMPR